MRAIWERGLFLSAGTIGDANGDSEKGGCLGNY